ncbi:MAG TPA: hypothetical protein VFO12_06390 [Sphingomicrobium sp.]|nr:hypothetical protein [Sphingomicrobium sp.]
MGHVDRKYQIVEAGIGGPPKGSPVLADRNGNPLPSDQLLIFNKNADKMRKVDHYRIRFDIRGFGSSPLRFTPNLDDALWVKKGTGPGNCPTSAIHDMSDVIWIDDMDSNGEWIDVINMDMKVEEFWFTLNLVDKSNPTSTNYVPVDPGGGNQNGGFAGSTLGGATTLATISLGIGAGLVAFFGAKLLLNGQ